MRLYKSQHEWIANSTLLQTWGLSFALLRAPWVMREDCIDCKLLLKQLSFRWGAFCKNPPLSQTSPVIPLTCSLGCFTKHFIEKIGYKMVLRQPAYRQQVGTLYEMTSPSSLWNASPQTTRVQKHAARHRATTQSFHLSTNARARNPDSTNASEPRFQPEVWRHNGEQERGDTTGENQWGKWCKMKNVTFMVCKQEKNAFVP